MDEVLTLVIDPQAAAADAERLFVSIKDQLEAVLLASAVIDQVGATAVPGCETKGDLDIAIRVPADDFAACRALLSERYANNPGSIRTSSFAAFVDEAARPPLGIQLVVVGSEFDIFSAFRDRFVADPALVLRYNALKRSYQGRSADDYRRAKGEFMDAVLSGKAPG